MIRTPTRRLPRAAAEGSPGFSALLSALLPGLGQLYQQRWRRGTLMFTLPVLGIAGFAGLVVVADPIAAAVIRRAALLALIVAGGLFVYHVAIVADAFAGRSDGGSIAPRHTIDYALLLAVVLGLGIGYLSLYRQTTAWATVVSSVFVPTTAGRVVGAGTPIAETTAPGWSGHERLNVLLLGIDTREDDPQTLNTDTVIVVSLDPNARTAAMLSIPRDTLVAIPGSGKDKVNAAYAHADDPAKDGAELARRTVAQFLGIPIHSYAVIDFGAFRQIVDSTGGVLVDVREPLRDEDYPTADAGIERIEFRGGPQVMNGDDALRYARSRHESNDFARARRQQAMIFALRSRFANVGLFRLPSIIERVGPLVRTNFDPGNVIPLARSALSVDTADIHSEVLLPCGIDVPHCELTEENGPAGYYLIPDLQKVRALVADLFAGRRPASVR